MNKLKALDLANYILTQSPDNSISPMKLQKLAFYCKVWTLVAGSDSIDAPFKKWQYGPVNNDIFQKFKEYSKKVIPPSNTYSQEELSCELKSQIDFILKYYGTYTASELSNMTHDEEPWVNTPDKEVITDRDIISYYSKQPFANNFNEYNSHFHIIEDDVWHAFTLDMDKDEISLFQSFNSETDYKEKSASANSASDKLFENIYSKYVSA